MKNKITWKARSVILDYLIMALAFGFFIFSAKTNKVIEFFMLINMLIFDRSVSRDIDIKCKEIDKEKSVNIMMEHLKGQLEEQDNEL